MSSQQIQALPATNIDKGVHLPLTFEVLRDLLAYFPYKVTITQHKFFQNDVYIQYQYVTHVTLPFEGAVTLEIIEMPDNKPHRGRIEMALLNVDNTRDTEAIRVSETYRITEAFAELAKAQFTIIQQHTKLLDTYDLKDETMFEKLEKVRLLLRTLEADFKEGFYSSALGVGVQFNPQSGYYSFIQ